MHFAGKKIFSGTLAAILFFFLTLFAAHFHTQKQGTEKDNCSLCQASHSFQKQGLSPSSIKVFHFQSAEEIILVSQEVSSFHFFFSSPSRAPPVSI